MDYYNQDEKESIKELNSSINGISSAEAKKRLGKYGLNEIKEKSKLSAIRIFLSQFNNFIIFILLGAVILSIVIREYVDAIVIGMILLLNSFLGFLQEYRAEKSIEALKKFISLKARVLRDGKESIIPAKEIVPGDIIILEEGFKMSADARLLEAYSLSMDESTLTGESVPAKKNIGLLKGKQQIAEQKNMIFSGTSVATGKGKAIVVDTGENTEIGKIATLIQETKKDITPLQKQLEKLSKNLGIITIAICTIAFLAIWIKGGSVFESLILGIALAVAAIPEGLPAIVTIGLALGTRRMLKSNVLIRKLPSVETLGCTTVICADKTGTLTLNKMSVTKIYADRKIINTEKTFRNDYGVEMLLKIGAICNNAALNKNNSIGDPTEIALLNIAKKTNITKDSLENKYKRMHEEPFSSERKMMSTVNRIGSKKIMFTKGAPDIILKFCNRELINGKIRPLTKESREIILKANEEFAKGALRVLGFAYKETEGHEEKDLIFAGLQGMIDMPRKEVKKAIEQCKTAGIKVVMITGDHKLTAEAIGKEIGIVGRTITGEELDNIKDLAKVVDEISIYARVNPIHKLKIIEALKKKEHVVAMTGDGVNDAPALKKSDIGIAIGSGTDVSKEAADMVLTDDNFASIVNAIREGRGIYDNIVKFVLYLLSSNIGEVLLIFISIIIGLPLPLLALQLLWINLVTDGLPALALSVDPIEKGVMNKKPRKKNDYIINKRRIALISLIGIVFAAGIILLYKSSLNKGYAYATTVAFAAVVVYEMFNVFNFRSERNSILKEGLFGNNYLILAIMSSILLQLIVIYTPLNNIFKITYLDFQMWIIIAMSASSILLAVEIFKAASKKMKIIQ